MKWLGIGIVVLLAIVGVAITWSNATPTYLHRFQMTVVVSADGSERTGSSMVEVIWTRQPQFLPVPQYVASVRGEAPVVDVGDGRLLVALMRPAEASYRPTPWEFLAMLAYGLPDDTASIPLIATQRGIRELHGDQIPAMVLFQDAKDPASARVVRPSGDGALAPGLALKGVTIELTSAPLVFTIEQKIPWWGATGRPWETALRAWLGSNSYGSSVGPKELFQAR